MQVYGSSIQTTSDRRLKSNITNIEDALGKIQQLRGVKFRYSNHSSANQSGVLKEDEALQIGFIAQEVREVEPDLVSQPKSGSQKDFLHMNYAGVTPILVEAMKQLRQEFTLETEALKLEISSLRSQLQTLERRTEGAPASKLGTPGP